MESESLQNKTIDNPKSDPYFDGDEVQIKLHKAIAALPKKTTISFKMKYFEELKYEQISEILGTSVGALKASYHHAVKKIEVFVMAIKPFVNRQTIVMKVFKLEKNPKSSLVLRP
jgi:RNA polymerase sigma-70 factor (ECF subfamily)